MRESVSLSVIIPCYNESQGLEQLEAALASLWSKLEDHFQAELIFVDDGSTDDTYARLQSLFANWKNVRIARHATNRNLGAALRTGVSQSQASLIAFLDSDCTYAPELLLPLLALVTNKNCLASVSPYHPAGAVHGVPAWRLTLSRGLSLLLSLSTHAKIFTFTAMVRAMPRELFWQLATPTNDFTFMSETMARACMRKITIKELPCTLTVRRFGSSKMKVLRTIAKQLLLLGRICIFRKSFTQEYHLSG